MAFSLAGIVLAVSLASWSSFQQADSSSELLPIRVRTHDKAAVRAATFETAADLARRILAGVGIVPEWIDCDGAAPPACAAAERGEFLLRIVSSQLDKVSHGCGVSLRPQGGDEGYSITVYADCVRKRSDEVHVAESVMLAYTIVHEIGHLLLLEGHSYTGIMRARPDRNDWQRAASGALTFADDEVHQIRAALVHGSESTPVHGARPLGEKAARLLTEARRLSPTVRGLLAALDASDVIAFVQVRIPQSLDTGELRFVGTAGGVRYLEIDVFGVDAVRLLTPWLAHELQHAVEIASAPWVRDEADLKSLYQRIGRPCRNVPYGFETESAIEITKRVRTEVAHSQSGKRMDAVRRTASPWSRVVPHIRVDRLSTKSCRMPPRSQTNLSTLADALCGFPVETSRK